MMNMENLVKAVAQVLDAGRKMYNIIYAEYEKSGAIYGYSHEGMMRWLEELHKISDLQNEIDDIRENHQMLQDLSELLAKGQN